MSDAIADIPTESEGELGVRIEASRIPALTIISHPAMERAGQRLYLGALEVGGEVAISRMSPEFRRRGRPSGAPLRDPFVSRKPFVITSRSGGGVLLQVPEDGTSVSIGSRSIRGEVELGPEELARGVPLVLCQRIVLLLHLAEPEGAGPEDELGMVGDSDGLRRVREQIRNVVDLNVPVLVRGETGTGKERVAQAVHQHGPRRERELLSVNVAGISKELVAAELFGAKRGAFTGAVKDRDGLFQKAHGGTLFLDEVGEAPTEVQTALLRTLDDGEILPVGGQTPVKVDVRVVAATDADLEARMQTGQFRAPLLHRLQGYQIRLPPLRERREDIGLLFAHFARETLESVGESWRLAPEDPRAAPWLPVDLALAFLEYPWPGNIRELRNLTSQLIINNRGRQSLVADEALARLLRPSPATAPGPSTTEEEARTTRRKPADVSREELLAALEACDFELAAAAERLGLVRGSLQNLMKRYDIPAAADISLDDIRRCHQECGGKLTEMARRLKVSRLALKVRVKWLGLELDES